jgi:hypothetical protein
MSRISGHGSRGSSVRQDVQAGGSRWAMGGVRALARGLSVWAALMLLFGIQSSEAIGATPADAGIGPNTFELLPYQAPDYKYLIIQYAAIAATPRLTPTLDGFADPGFDLSNFKDGKAPFGHGIQQCPLQTTVRTDWPINTELLVRRTVEFPEGATNVRIMVAVNNDIKGVFVNGNKIAANLQHQGCAIQDEFRFDVPGELLQPGLNIVAFDVVNREAVSFFDARILADISAAQLGRLASIPGLVPVSNVSVVCQNTVSATVNFLVTGSGEAGTVKITQANNKIISQHLLNRDLMFSVTDEPTRDTIVKTESFKARVDSRRLHNILGLLALSTASARREVRVSLRECFNPPGIVLAPENCLLQARGTFIRCAIENANPFCEDLAMDDLNRCTNPPPPPPPPPSCDPDTQCCEDAPLCE